MVYKNYEYFSQFFSSKIEQEKQCFLIPQKFYFLAPFMNKRFIRDHYNNHIFTLWTSAIVCCNNSRCGPTFV